MKKQKAAGFTVVELLLAITLFAILIPAIVTGINNLTTTNNRARDLAIVNMLAQNKVEQLRSAGYNSVPTGTTNFSNELPSTLGTPRSASYTVTNSASGIKEVTLTISYRDYGKTKTVDYKTIISEIGVGQ